LGGVTPGQGGRFASSDGSADRKREPTRRKTRSSQPRSRSH